MNKLSFHNFEITKNIGYAFLGLAMALALLIDFGLIVRPQIKALSSVGHEASELSAHIKKIRYNVNNISLLQAVVGQLQEKLNKAEKDLIGHEEIAMVIEGITQLAAKYDIQINQIMPSEDPAKALKEGPGGFLAVPISVNAEGGYHNIGLFLNAVEAGQAFLDIHSFEIMEIPQSVKKHILTMAVVSFIPKKSVE